MNKRTLRGNTHTEPDASDLRTGAAATHVYACLAMVIVDWKVAAAASVELVGLFYLYSRSLLSTHATTSHRSAGMLRTCERQEGSHAVPRAC
jgi:hypothetical protein